MKDKKMRRVLLISILGVILVAVLVFIVGSFWRGSIKGVGKITVMSEPAGLSVYIDDEFVGESPVEHFSVASGDHTVRIGESWREKVMIASDVESAITREFTYNATDPVGYTLSYEPITTFFNQGAHMVVTSDPSGAEVFINEKSQGTTPLVVSDEPLGGVSVVLRKSGYETMTVGTQLVTDTILRVSTSLRSDPFTTLQRVVLGEGVAPGADMTDFTLTPRSEWGGSVIKTNNIPITLTPWNQFSLWGAQVETTELASYLVGLDTLSQDRFSVPSMPFAYVIDENGKVYEGVGILDYDFAAFPSIAELDFQSGIAPVLLLSQSGEYNTPALKDALSQLLTYFEQEPVVTAQILSKPSPLTLQAGDTQAVEVSVQNTSPLIWRRDSFYQMQLRMVDKEFSSVYDAETWVAPNVLAALTEDEVLPGEVATFLFNVRAPFYSSTSSEQVVLYSVTQDKVVSNASFSLDVKSEGETTNVLSIEPTPTGFLNVRSGPGINFELLTTVFPGETYAWVVEDGGWYQIIMRDGSKGWITNQYVTLQ